MTTIESITLEAPDPAAARAFCDAAFDLDGRVGFRASEEPTAGFRGFTLSLLVSQPSTVDALAGTAREAGATVLKPAKKSMWGHGAVVQSPDGAIWKIATSSKKETESPNRRVDEVVLLLGVADIAASKRFYSERGLAVAKSFPRKYVQFETTPRKLTLGLYGRGSLAKDAGVPADGSGSHRIVIGGSGGAFTDPDGFAWETVA